MQSSDDEEISNLGANPEDAILEGRVGNELIVVQNDEQNGRTGLRSLDEGDMNIERVHIVKLDNWMMGKSEEQIRKKIGHFEGRAESLTKKLESGTLPEENVPKGKRMAGDKLQSLGLYKLPLGECVDATAEFTRSAEWYIDSLEELRNRRNSTWESEANHALYVLYSGVLSGDPDIAHRAASIALDVPEKFVDRFPTTYWYYLVKALAATVLDTGAQERYLNEMRETLDDLDGTNKTFFEALWEALSGIVHRNEQEFENGVERLLEWHDGKVDFENRTDANDLVSRQGVTLVVLARRTGMDVCIDSEYVPGCVYELA